MADAGPLVLTEGVWDKTGLTVVDHLLPLILKLNGTAHSLYFMNVLPKSVLPLTLPAVDVLYRLQAMPMQTL